MPNLKLDLLNKLKNDKYYTELEMVRLAQDPNTNYEYKINDLITSLKKIANINNSITLTEQYFVEQPKEQPLPEPTKLIQGQTHGE